MDAWDSPKWLEGGLQSVDPDVSFNASHDGFELPCSCFEEPISLSYGWRGNELTK